MEATAAADAYAANCVYVEALEEIVKQLKEQENKILARIQCVQSHQKAARLAIMENMLGRSILLDQQHTTNRHDSKNNRHARRGKQKKELMTTKTTTANPLSFFSRPTEIWADVDIYTNKDSIFFRNVRTKYPDPKVLLPSLSRKWDDQERLQLCRSVDFYLQQHPHPHHPHPHHHHRHSYFQQQQHATRQQQHHQPLQLHTEKESCSASCARVRRMLTMLDWAYIHQWHHSTKLQPQRSKRSCAHRYALWQEEEIERQYPWTDAEDSALEKEVIRLNHDWIKIASAMAARITAGTSPSSSSSSNSVNAVATHNAGEDDDHDVDHHHQHHGFQAPAVAAPTTHDASFPERLPVSYLIRYQTKKVQAAIDSHTNVEWTEDEDNCLRDAVAAATMKSQHALSSTTSSSLSSSSSSSSSSQDVRVMSHQNLFFWKSVVKLNKRLHGRTPNQCGARWRYALAPSIVHGNFSVDEDRRLLLAVAAFQEHPPPPPHHHHHHRPHVDWMRVQTMLCHRTNVQCRERFQDVLDPFKNVQPFTTDEDTRLHQLVAVHGAGSWAKMTASFHGRTPAQLRQRWKIIGRRYAS